MNKNRPYVLSVAGFDPSGGAGILADIKTLEQHHVYGIAVITGITLQAEEKFHWVKWENVEEVAGAIEVLMNVYKVDVVKTGIVPSLEFLSEIISCVKKNNPSAKIIVDPVIRSSTGFDLLGKHNWNELKKILENIFLLTPNADEAMKLTGDALPEEAAKKLSAYCHVLLKGGHHRDKPGTDQLFTGGSCIEIQPFRNNIFSKHGSGCVLSSAIAAEIASGRGLETACTRAKKYTEEFLFSNSSLLGYHHV
ncbi:MAG: hydroxymethylpyrimidine/phosphomethylpyrimidine kinase [Bacteroidetes bacterium]|nr:hydroxymethylpyrimidine/phosphomethylpyrimidine kinase [Bacteroidota bacterium]